MDKIFTLKNYKIASLIFSFLFLFFGIFKVNDASKFLIDIRQNVSIPALIIGSVFLVISVVIYFELGVDLFNLNAVKIKCLKNDGLCVQIERSCIFVHFNRLEEVDKKSDVVVVLPANEYFDDECIRDKKSSLGAYIDKNFKNQIDEFQKSVRHVLAEKSFPSTLQKKKEDETLQNSYGVGTCLLLTKPINSSENILLVSVTEQRAGLGLYSNISFVYKAVNEIYKKVVDNRIRDVYIPLLGSGHGGLNKRVAFLALVTAFAELMKKDGKINSLNIVVYKNGKDINISRRIVRKILKFGVGLAISKESGSVLSTDLES